MWKSMAHPILAAVVLSCLPLIKGSTITLFATRDTHILSSARESNYGNWFSLLVGGSDAGIWRTLVFFDFFSLVGASGKLVSATLELSIDITKEGYTPCAESRGVGCSTVHLLGSHWGEGSGPSTVQQGQCTWEYSAYPWKWITPGGDFQTLPVGERMPESVGDSIATFQLDPIQVQELIDMPSLNRGFIIQDDSNPGHVDFHSRECVGSSNLQCATSTAPQLRLEFEEAGLPTPAPFELISETTSPTASPGVDRDETPSGPSFGVTFPTSQPSPASADTLPPSDGIPQLPPDIDPSRGLDCTEMFQSMILEFVPIHLQTAWQEEIEFLTPLYLDSETLTQVRVSSITQDQRPDGDIDIIIVYTICFDPATVAFSRNSELEDVVEYLQNSSPALQRYYEFLSIKQNRLTAEIALRVRNVPIVDGTLSAALLVRPPKTENSTSTARATTCMNVFTTTSVILAILFSSW